MNYIDKSKADRIGMLREAGKKFKEFTTHEYFSMLLNCSFIITKIKRSNYNSVANSNNTHMLNSRRGINVNAIMSTWFTYSVSV